jgi:hypothetical protein
VAGLREGNACPECGRGRLVLGALRDYHGLRFRPLGQPWWRWGRRVAALACESCGYMAMRLGR